MKGRLGRLIAFEGPDSAGKTTQVNILKERFEKEGKEVAVFKFPTYERTYYGRLLRRYLNGEFGKIDEVSPYLAGVLYALDRLEMRDEIINAINKGKIVLFDRYIGSNKAHMGAKIKNNKEREKFIKWVDELDFQKNKMPRENMVVFLDMPVENSLELMQIGHKKRDIHEKDIAYMKRVYEVYKKLAKSEKWARIKCVDNGKIMNRWRIAEEIYRKVKRILS